MAHITSAHNPLAPPNCEGKSLTLPCAHKERGAGGELPQRCLLSILTGFHPALPIIRAKLTLWRDEGMQRLPRATKCVGGKPRQNSPPPHSLASTCFLRPSPTEALPSSHSPVHLEKVYVEITGKALGWKALAGHG